MSSGATATDSKTVLGADTRRRRRSWILKMGDNKWLSPIRLFIVVSLVLGPVSYVAGTPILTAIILAYLLAITNYLVHKQQRELHRLRPILCCDDQVFSSNLKALGTHPIIFLNAAWIVGPVVAIVVNFNGPVLSELRAGAQITPQVIWGMILALMFWVSMCHMLVIIFLNSSCFARIGAKLARIDLIDTSGLVPFARVGIRNLLIFAGGYALIVLVYIDGWAYLPGTLISLIITLPIAVILAVLPMSSVRRRIAEEKDRELDRIQKAMHGDYDALSDSPIAKDSANIGFTGLVLYRQLVQDINEWPMDSPVFLRMSLYIIIPLLTWFGAALVERIVDSAL